MKDLAVLITIYNDQDGLTRVLDSIEEPDYSFTVVVVDGGSDEPPVINRSRYPFEIVLIEETSNRGMASGLNTGLDYICARGFAFVARLDAGDLQRRHRLAIQYRRFQESEDLVLLGSNAVFRVEETGRELFVTNLPRTWKQIRKWSVFRTCFIHPTIMLRLAPLGGSYRYDLRYPHIEDYVLFTRIARKFPTEILEEPLLDCFIREAGTSRKHDRAQLLSGLRHHLRHPLPLNPLWHAYILKRIAFLVVPYRLRVWSKQRLGLVKRSPESSESSSDSARCRTDRFSTHTLP